MIDFTLHGVLAPNAGKASWEQSDSYKYKHLLQLPKLMKKTCRRQLVPKANKYNITERTAKVFPSPDVLEDLLDFRLGTFLNAYKTLRLLYIC